MLKASELRIGNLVYNPVQKINIKVDGGLIATESMREKSVKNYKGFKPIPLTEEWLLKFGFEGHDYKCPENNITYKNVEFTLDLDESVSINIQEDFSYMLCDLNYNESISLCNDYISYVHQLQNLYFVLTGNELEIKE